MVFRIKMVILVLCGLVFLGGCTELGDLIVFKYKFKGGNVALAELDGNFLSKRNLGKSPYCLTRRSAVDSSKWMGICLRPETQTIAIYRAFSNKFNIQNQGLTNEVLNSEGFEEVSKISDSVDIILNNKGIKFEKSGPEYIPFEILNKEYLFTR